MAISFGGSATTDYVSVPANTLYTPTAGLTVSLWAYFPTGWSAASTNYGRVYDASGTGSGTGGTDLEKNGASGNFTWYNWSAGANTSIGSFSLTPTDDVWQHWIATIDGSGNGAVFIDGSASGTSSGHTLATDSHTILFGKSPDARYLNFRMAEFAVWQVALDAGERLALQRGYSPLLVRPQSLNGYIPMIQSSGVADRKIGNAFTVSGTANVDHPRVLLPRRRQTAHKAAAGGFSTALFRSNAGVGASGGGPFARANAGVGAL